MSTTTKQRKKTLTTYARCSDSSRNKYHAQKVVVDGRKFDSKKEAERYAELRLMERAGVISDLRLQVNYVVIPAQRIDGKVAEKQATYKADFVYVQDGVTIVEDVKGYKKGQAYQLFVLKRKLMLERYGVRIKEI